MSITQWRKKGKHNGIPKFVTMWRQWREVMRAPPAGRSNGRAVSFEIDRIMD